MNAAPTRNESDATLHEARRQYGALIPTAELLDIVGKTYFITLIDAEIAQADKKLQDLVKVRAKLAAKETAR